MTKWIGAVLLGCCIVVLSSFTMNNNDGETESNKVNWLTLEEVEELSKEEPRMIIIDVYTDWCGWCKKLDKEVFNHPQIAEYIGEKYYAVKLDAETKETITIAGQEFKFVKSGRKGYNELAHVLLDGKMSFPSMVIMDKQLAKVQVVSGYLEPPDMDSVLRYFGDGYFESGIAGHVFQRNFKSKIKPTAPAHKSKGYGQ